MDICFRCTPERMQMQEQEDAKEQTAEPPDDRFDGCHQV